MPGRSMRVILAVVLAVLAHGMAGLARAQEQTGKGELFETLLHKGFDAHQKNDYATAIPLLQRAWRLQPRDYFANLLLGIDLLRSGQTEESIRFLKEAARQRPKEEFPQEYLGEANGALQRYSEAASAYGKALEVAPESAQAKMGAVSYYLARFAEISRELRSTKGGLAAEYRLEALRLPVGDAARKELLERAASLDDAVENWGELAKAQILTGETAAGEESLQRARKSAPEDLGVLEAEALLAATRGEWDEAEKKLNAIAARSPGILAGMAKSWPGTLVPKDGVVLRGAAYAFLQCVKTGCKPEVLRGKLPPAMMEAKVTGAELFREQRWENIASRKVAESDAAAWAMRGIALGKLENCKQGIPALERGLADGSGATEKRYLLSWCYAREAGQVAASLQASTEDDALEHLMRGDVLLRLQANSEGAVTQYQAAVKGRPNDPSAWERLAEAQLATGRNDEARKSAEEALRIDPQRLPAIRVLAKAAMEERQYGEALPYLRELAKRNPKDATTRVELATACAQTGAYEEAYKNLAPALEAGYPDEKGSLHYQLGTILKRMGRAEEAGRAFAAAKELSDRFQRTSRQEKEGKQE